MVCNAEVILAANATNSQVVLIFLVSLSSNWSAYGTGLLGGMVAN